jgi:hypothetical protein
LNQKQNQSILAGLVLLCLLMSNQAWSQQQDYIPSMSNIVSLEILGNGGYGSFNYERLVYHKQRSGLGFSIGISTFKTKDFRQKFNPDIIVPFSARFYFGSERHKVFVGIGQTLSSVSKLNTDNFEPERVFHLSANFMVGYRYDFKRVMLRLAYTPIFQNYTTYKNWLGFAVGYKF